MPKTSKNGKLSVSIDDVNAGELSIYVKDEIRFRFNEPHEDKSVNDEDDHEIEEENGSDEEFGGVLLDISELQ